MIDPKDIKAIIFDWGRTLYDKENDKLFPETLEVVEYCFKKYKNLAIVSLAVDSDIEGRFKQVDKNDLRKYFKLILFHSSDKDTMYRNALANLNFKPENVLVVDDRTIRLQWPNFHGCQTIWLEKGNFSVEKPNTTTGFPGHTIHNLKEILEVI